MTSFPKGTSFIVVHGDCPRGADTIASKIVDDDNVAYLNDKRIIEMDWQLSKEEVIEIVTEELADLIGERVRRR